MRFCKLCKHWSGENCKHPERAFVEQGEYGCQYFSPKNEQARIEAIKILQKRQSQLSEETEVIRKWARVQLERAGINPERLARAVIRYWRLAPYEPRSHSPKAVSEARKLRRKVRSAAIEMHLTRIIKEHERAKALEEIETARRKSKIMYWQETVRQSLTQRITQFLDGDLKLAWLIATSNKEDFEMILKTGKQQVWKTRREPRIPPHIKKYCNRLMTRDLDISEVPKSVLDELLDRGLATISEEVGVVQPTEYLQMLFFDRKI